MHTYFDSHQALLADKKKLQGFFDSTKGKFQHPTVKAWAEALYEEREQVLKDLD
jgi:putative hydrolase of HD superfamily